MKDLIQQTAENFRIFLQERNYVPSRNEMVSFIATAQQTAWEAGVNKTKMNYLLAFGNYVPLSGQEVEPEIMAKEVTDIWKETWIEWAIGECEKENKRISGVGIQVLDSLIATLRGGIKK